MCCGRAVPAAGAAACGCAAGCGWAATPGAGAGATTAPPGSRLDDGLRRGSCLDTWPRSDCDATCHDCGGGDAEPSTRYEIAAGDNRSCALFRIRTDRLGRLLAHHAPPNSPSETKSKPGKTDHVTCPVRRTERHATRAVQVTPNRRSVVRRHHRSAADSAISADRRAPELTFWVSGWRQGPLRGRACVSTRARR